MISVILPVFNGTDTVVAALNSIVRQKGQHDFEVIIINDGSTDNSLQVINEFTESNKDLNIKIFSKPNGGVSSARNVGLKECLGDYITFLDADDEWLPEKINLQLETLSQNNVSFCGSLPRNAIAPVNANVRNITARNLVYKNYFQPSTVMMRREVFNTIGFFDENQKYAEEGNYFIRVAKEYKCIYMNKDLIIYGQGKRGFGKSGLSANLVQMELGELSNIKLAYKLKVIKLYELPITYLYSLLKFLRRCIIVKFS